MKKIILIVALSMLATIPFYLEAQTSGVSIVSVAEQMPEYPGGTDSLMNDVIVNVIYPKLCLDSNIQGKVYLRFVVNEDGTLSNIEAVKSPNKLLSESAIAAIEKIKKFKPGKQNGKPVKVWSSVPVSFKIKADTIVAQSTEHLAKDDTTKKFKFVEVMPVFPGGDAELIKFIQTNLQYPQQERQNEIQGKVLVKFVIREDGSVDSVTVVKGVSPGLDKEAVRMVRGFPKFKPGTQQGKPVIVQYMLPVIFKLDYGGYTRQKSILDYFKGGSDGISDFFFRNIVYPSAAALTQTEAVIKVTCKLQKDLKLHPTEIKNDLDSLFTTETLRVINALPSFDEDVKQTASFFEDSYEVDVIFTLDKKHQTHTVGVDKRESQRLATEGADFFKGGKLDKALDYFNAAIKYYSLNSDAFYNRAVIELKTNKIADAFDDFRRAYLLGDLDAMNGIKQTCK